MKFNLNQVMTPSEAAERWGQKRNTIIAGLTRALEKKEGKWYSVIEKNLVRYNGDTKDWYLTKNAMEEIYGEEKKMKTLTIEKRKKFEHIIGTEFNEEYTARTKTDVEVYFGHIVDDLDDITGGEHQDEIDSIYALENGSYSINDGDFVYYIDIKDEE